MAPPGLVLLLSFVGVSGFVALGNLKVSEIGFGTLGLPLDRHTDEATKATFEALAGTGVNLIDTAEAYGLGNAETLAGWASEAVGAHANMNFATKFAPLPWRQDKESVVNACKASAARLGVESIALYQIHYPDFMQPLGVVGITDYKDETYWEGLAECYHQGLCQNVGVSNYNEEMLTRAHDYLSKRGVPLASNQIDFSILNRRPGTMAAIHKARELGVSTLGYFPLASGLLAGAFDMDHLPPFPRSITMYNFLKQSEPLLKKLHEIGGRRDKTPAQVSLNWIIQQGVIPLPGIQCPEHAVSNAGAIGWSLTPEECIEIEEAADAAGDPWGRWVDTSMQFLDS